MAVALANPGKPVVNSHDLTPKRGLLPTAQVAGRARDVVPTGGGPAVGALSAPHWKQVLRGKMGTKLPPVIVLGLLALVGSSRGSHPFIHLVTPPLHPRLYHGCYGDIMTMETPGASCDRSMLINCGIRGSEMFAEMDLRAIKPYQTLIKEVGQRHCVDPALIAAIISRESHGGTILLDGWNHTGLKFGLMQLDKKMFHPVGAWDSKEHLLQAVGILTDRIKAMQKKFPTWSAVQHLKGGLSAFKSGVEAIVTPLDVDTDFFNDLVARAKFYKRHGF
ncbi:lysozyme g-like protein 2 [Dasypus novemcinctus]|uniref:lysozyme g-like protein 2 n=1 Tax=Dasypus novemcinctus TaxID=9361 RepID=UPI00265E7DEF|nr:lysozyme g-like protein 2 [Dasypus novemcinctus]